MRRLLLTTLLLAGCEPADPLVEPETDATPDASVDVDAAVDAPDAAPDVAPRPDGAPPDAAPPPPADECPPATVEEGRWLEPGVEHIDKLCRGRSAWYRVEVPAGHAPSVVLRFRHETGDLELRLFDADGALLAESTTATDEERGAGPVAEAPTHVAIEVFGYQNAGGKFRVLPRLFSIEDADRVHVEGTVSFEDRPYGPEGHTGERVPTPAADVVVEAVRDEDGAVVAQSVAGADGAFTLDFPAQPTPHTVRAVAEVRHRGFVARVREARGGLPYAVAVPLPDDARTEEGGRVELLAGADDAVGGAFNIVDAARDAFVMLADAVETPAPALTYRWAPGHAFPCGSCYSNDTIQLGGQLEDPDEFDDVIVLHELGHYFAEHYTRDDSPGGTHRDMAVSPQLAYGEGLAYFFAGLVRDDPHIVDTYIDRVRWIDIEAMHVGGAPDPALLGTVDGRSDGDLREEVIAGLMWDAYDEGDDEAHDTLGIGAESTLHLLTEVVPGRQSDAGPRGMDLNDWLEALACLVGVEPVQPLVDERAFPRTLEDGEFECQKSRIPAPYTIEQHGGELRLVGVADAPVVVAERVVGGKWRRRLVACDAPCRIAAARPDVALVVTTPDARWAGASWLGKAAASALLGGRVHAGARTYRSR